jgi:hypothetical protein
VDSCMDDYDDDEEANESLEMWINGCKNESCVM